MPKLTPNATTVDEQMDFVKKFEEIRQFSGVEILFCDGMHLVHQAKPTFCWFDPKDPPTLIASTGRKRLNIMGAFNTKTMELIHHSDESPCDGDKTIKLFEQISGHYSQAHSVVIILDNASYFRSKKVRKWLENNPNVICWFLPTYSPNLNLIERFWRFAKKHLVNNTYYKYYKTFRCTTFRLLNSIRKYREELDSLMVEKFQILGKNRA